MKKAGGDPSLDKPHNDVGQSRFALPIVPRYAEVDQQAVVFNAHYLVWFDEACSGFLDHLRTAAPSPDGVSYPDLVAGGHDLQVVHSELDYTAPVRWRDTVEVQVRCERVGSTSFALGFTVIRTDRAGVQSVAARGMNVYVVVSTDDWAKRPIPAPLREALCCELDPFSGGRSQFG